MLMTHNCIFNPENAESLPLIINNIQKCVIDIKLQMTANMLELNIDKTEVLILMNKSLRNPITIKKSKLIQSIYQLQAASEILVLYLTVL